jgi:Icc-related predicted phosphoesterase
MKLQIVSDLHLEHHRDRGQQFIHALPHVADTFVVAGDLCNNDELFPTLGMLCAKWKDVVYVFGNHELYGHSFEAVRDNLDYIVSRLPNLHVLDNSIIVLRGRRFVGTTLWFRESRATQRNRSRLNDFKAIENYEAHVYKENAEALKFLEAEVQPRDIVITHHIPTAACVPARFVTDPINHFFLCDVEKLIRARKPLLWIFGHTHDTVDKIIGDTRCICNPFGYPWQNTGFMDDLVVDV